MKVIISNQLEDKYTNFFVYPSFKQAIDINGVDTLIIHKYQETEFDVGLFISKFKEKGVSKFIYISDTPSTTLRTILNGVDGHYYEDEFYFEDEDELLALLEEIDSGEENSQLAVAEPAIDVLNDFVGAFTRGDERANTKALLDAVKDSITSLSTTINQQGQQIVAMGESTVSVFNKASQIISNLSEQSKKLAEKVEELENGAGVQSSSKASFSNNILYFTPFVYRSNAKVLFIREYAPCRYLTSFALGYLHHLHYELNRRPKLVFIVQKGAGIASKYSDYPIITQDNMNLGSLYNGEVVVTNNPKREVMKELLSKPNDVFVVVDRLYGQADIVSGRIVRVNALSSRSDIARYDVKAEDSIFSVTKQPRELFDIPVIKSFPIETETRYATYSQVMGDRYTILDAKLGLRVGE